MADIKKNKDFVGSKRNMVLIVLVIILSSVYFLYWKNKQEVKIDEPISIFFEGLPEEIGVVFQNQTYKITHKKNNYSFVLPEDWQKIKKINCFSEQDVGGYLVSGAFFEGESDLQEITVNKITNDLLGLDIISMSQIVSEDFEFKSIPDTYRIGSIVVVTVSVGDTEAKKLKIFLFKKGSNAYSVSYTDVEAIEKIIKNGEW